MSRPDREWEPPSERATALIRGAIEQLLAQPGELLERVDAATFAVNDELLELEPGLADGFRAAVRSLVAQWATAALRDPGQPVAANLSLENTELVRDIVRHGFDATILTGFRASQNVAIAWVQEMAFELSDDPQLVREVIAVITRSIFAYIDDTLSELTALIEQERAQLRDTTHAARMETVSLLLEGAPIARQRASQRLGHELDRLHTAAVVWADDRDGAADVGDLESAATALARAARVQRPLVVLASASAMWVWLSGRRAPDLAGLRDAWPGPPGVRVALGRPATGVAGFRASHFEAVSTQRLVRRLALPAPVTTYPEVELLALLAADEERAAEFVARTLGSLATAPREVRETLLVFLREQCNATRTAQVLFAHRNTILGRLDRARALLPDGLDGHVIPVGLALELNAVLDS